MKTHKKRYIQLDAWARYSLGVLVCMIIAHFSFAQNVGIRTDKSSILIGERIKYELLVKLPEGGFAVQADIPDTIPHFELLTRTNFDTSQENGSWSLHQTIEFTSFDSGQWHIPSFPVMLQKNGSYKKFMTDSVLVNVGYSPADSSGQLRDIKPVMQVEVEDYFWWYVAGGALLLLIILWFLYRYWKNRPVKATPVLHSSLSPYEEAMKSLDELSATEPSSAIAIRKYHSRLSEIFKTYYSRVKNAYLLNKTTGDILLILRDDKTNQEVLSTLAEKLRIGDAVKFAKYLPGVTESRDCADAMRKQITHLNEQFKQNIN